MFSQDLHYYREKPEDVLLGNLCPSSLDPEHAKISVWWHILGPCPAPP